MFVRVFRSNQMTDINNKEEQVVKVI